MLLNTGQQVCALITHIHEAAPAFNFLLLPFTMTVLSYIYLSIVQCHTEETLSHINIFQVNMLGQASSSHHFQICSGNPLISI